MGRGLDGYLISVHWRCVVLKARERRGLYRFPVAMARGKHLFPFRTEPLSPSAPMVLGSQGPGRVGRRRFFLAALAALVTVCGRRTVVPVGARRAAQCVDARRLAVPAR